MRSLFPKCSPIHSAVRACSAMAVVGTLGAMFPRTAGAQVAPSFPDSSFASEKMISDGRSVYRGQGGCFVCHGQQLQGLVGPTLLNHPWKQAKQGAMAEIYRVVMAGVPGTTMVARPNGISDAQAKRVAAYVWAVGHQKAQP